MRLCLRNLEYLTESFSALQQGPRNHWSIGALQLRCTWGSDPPANISVQNLVGACPPEVVPYAQVDITDHQSRYRQQRAQRADTVRSKVAWTQPVVRRLHSGLINCRCTLVNAAAWPVETLRQGTQQEPSLFLHLFSAWSIGMWPHMSEILMMQTACVPFYYAVNT